MRPSTVSCYADVPTRIVALLVDAVLLTIIAFAGAVVVSVLVGPAVEFNTAADSAQEAVTLHRGIAVLDGVVSLFLSAAYFAGAWLALAASPGQRLIGVRIRGQDAGTAITPWQAMARWALLAAPFGVAAVLTTALTGLSNPIVDLAMITWYGLLLVTTVRSPIKQGLHDRIARTVVVKEASPVHWDRPTADVR
jgi:uncharacterized RDD family membrane protein YckC